jgi:hypothetical protein
LPPDRWYSLGRDTVEQAFLAMAREPDIDRPEDVLEYFSRLYHAGNTDGSSVSGCKARLKCGVSDAGGVR